MKRILSAALAVPAAALIERELIAAPHYRGPKSSHFDGRRFHNFETTEHGGGAFLKWQFTRENGYWRDWIDAPAGPPPPQRVPKGSMRVTFVNHSTLLLQMDNVNILTDPIWSERCSPFAWAGPKRHRRPGIRFADLPPIDLVLVSHNHYDHLDLPTLHALRRKHRPKFIVPLGSDLLLRKHGIRNVVALDWWESHERVMLVPSRHFCSRGLSDRDATLWGGFVVSGASGNAYFAGDTGFGVHLEEIAAQCAPIRLAMLPIGAYLPRWFMAPMHMSPDEAVRAHQVLKAAISVPMHYGTFNLGDDGELEPIDDLRRALTAAGHPNVVVLEHGDGRDV